MQSIYVIGGVFVERYDIDKLPYIDDANGRYSSAALVIAGNIGDVKDIKYEMYVKDCLYKFAHVFLITGSHEYAQGFLKRKESKKDIDDYMTNKWEKYPYVTVLNNSTDYYGGIKFINVKTNDDLLNSILLEDFKHSIELFIPTVIISNESPIYMSNNERVMNKSAELFFRKPLKLWISSDLNNNLKLKYNGRWIIPCVNGKLVKY